MNVIGFVLYAGGVAYVFLMGYLIGAAIRTMTNGNLGDRR